MALITIDDIYTRIYEENVDEITRDHDDYVLCAIDGAIAEAKMYLPRYDLTALFGTDTTDPTVTDTHLKILCVDIAVYRLTQICNTGVDYKRCKDSYDAALNTLKLIVKGLAQPAGWPYKDTSGQSAPQGSSISAAYNDKRHNDY